MRFVTDEHANEFTKSNKRDTISKTRVQCLSTLSSCGSRVKRAAAMVCRRRKVLPSHWSFNLLATLVKFSKFITPCAGGACATFSHTKRGMFVDVLSPCSRSGVVHGDDSVKCSRGDARSVNYVRRSTTDPVGERKRVRVKFTNTECSFSGHLVHSAM